MSDLFKDIPEFVEVDIGESLAARTEILGTFRELGPPDLCHVVKTTGSRTSSKEIGSYHYCSGVEASSSASLAAYLNSLTFAVEETGTWFTGKGSGWKVTQGTYCCFNAFSRVDVRVEVKIPGGVDAYVVDLRGERHEASPQIWQETYLSALLRAIRYADDPSYKLAGYRKLDPITSLEGELRFLEAAEALFFKGWQLGSDPEIQVATVISNHLTAGVLKYFGDAYRFEPAANLFEKLVDKEPEVASLLAKAYIGMNEEVRAIQVLSAAIKQNPQSYSLLHVQCDFLRSKGRNDWALKLAKQAVNCAPSEFVTWAKLTEVYIDLGMYDSALLTLNSCPMFTFNERDLHRMPTPSRTHLPVKQFIAASNILDEDAARDNEADVALLRLPAGGLRGTFALAYAILTKIVAKIGWDDLLKTRSSVFVMEEEYRKHKAKASVGAGLASADADGVGSSNDSGAGADDDASTRSIRSPAPPPIDTQVNGHSADALGIPENSIPTIKVSSESDHEREHALLAKHARGESIGVSPVKEDSEAEARAEQEDKDIHRNASMEAPVVEKPEQAHAMPTATTMTTTTTDVDAAAEEVPENSLDLKVLCERWLDGLFGTLYEDLRVYTIWRAEIAHFTNASLAYRKTGTEWEILGSLSQRLHHKEESKQSFIKCVEIKFSAKAWMNLLEYYADEGDLERGVNAAIRLATYQHRWYMESSYPTLVAHYLFKLGQTHGHAKIQYTLLSKSLPSGIMDIMQGFLDYGKKFQVDGYQF